ncbi:MAG: hypothetical protein FJY73_01025 [Candidatus Eisenbacteria bacterium]|nr:hypothetical protein [Candidatus Eisenbacteria bacterium]
MRKTGFILVALVLLACRAAFAEGPRAESLRFDFAGGDLLGWSAPTGRLAPRAGAARLDVEDEISSFLSPGRLAVDASRFNRLEIDVRVEPPEAGAVVYWTDDAERGFVPDWRLAIPSGRSVLDLSRDPRWRGTIDRFLLTPGPRARGASLVLFELRGARGFRERLRAIARDFSETELRAHYSVNGILGARIGPIPFSLLLGVLFVVLPFLLTLRSARRFPAKGARVLSRGLLAGTLLFLARAGCDEVRILRADTRVLAGKSLDEKIEATNPPGFYPLLYEAKRRIPRGAPVEFRAEKPYPWERGAYYLYPNRVADRANYVLSYRVPAPDDSAACELLFRKPGFGSVYRRKGG